ncbi:MAG: hypothetical protein WC536_00865 [Patescibacteria group bacterium]
MFREKYKSKNIFKIRNPRKTFGLMITTLAVLGTVYYFQSSTYKADETTTTSSNCKRGIVQNVKKNMGIDESCPARGSRLTVEVEKPFQNSKVSAYPDGKSCAYVNVEAIRKDGTFLTDEPLVIQKPASVDVSGPGTTSDGSIKLCFTSKSPIQARITIKIQSLPSVQRSFQLNFNPKFTILDQTDRNGFFYNLPITFTAQVDPAILPGLKEARLVYSYNRRVNVWGRWKAERREIDVPLSCSSDGSCSATIGTGNTSTKRVNNGTFNYRFTFVDQNGHRFSKSYNGRLTMP